MGYYPAINCFFQTLSSSLPLVFTHFDKFTTGWLTLERGWGLWDLSRGLLTNKSLFFLQICLTLSLEASLMMIQPLMFWLEDVLCTLGYWNEKRLRICSLMNIISCRYVKSRLPFWTEAMAYLSSSGTEEINVGWHFHVPSSKGTVCKRIFLNAADRMNQSRRRQGKGFDLEHEEEKGQVKKERHLHIFG